MIIEKNRQNQTLTVKLKGRLDVVTSSELQRALAEEDGYRDLTIDLKELEYISSAGLRVLLAEKKKLDEISGSLSVINSNDLVMDIFETTGFDKALKITR